MAFHRIGLVMLVACGSSAAKTSPDAAGSPDSSPAVDAAVDAPAIAACAGMYCDDFEGYAGGPLTNGAALGDWTVKISGAPTVAAVDSVKPYSGTKSLHVTVPAGVAAGATLYRLVAGGLVPNNNLFGRAMVFFSNADGNAAPVGVHSYLFQGLGTSTAQGGAVSMNWGDGGSTMQLNYHPFGTPEQSVEGMPQMAAGAWHCVQWQYDGSGMPAANVAKVWVDGTVVVSVPQTKGWEFATPWNAMNFGFMHFQTLATPADVYLDDFIVDKTMVACP
jgi:hypothetical protein